jgi:N4-gp56 family major capsid protein
VKLLAGGVPTTDATGSGYTNPQDSSIPAQGGSATMGYVDIMLQQRGALNSVSDIVRAIDLFDTLKVNTQVMAADAALDFDFVCSHAICSQAGQADQDGQANPIPAGQKTMYGSNTSFERFAGVVNTLNSATDYATLAAASNSNSKLTRAVHLGAVTRLKGVGGIPGVPMIGGKYKALVAPEVLFDLRQDAVWLASAQYNNNRKAGTLDDLTEFTLDGCDFVENQSPFIESTSNGQYGQYSPDVNGALSNNIYSNIYLGQEAFGVPKLSGMRAGSDPKAPSIIILDKPDKADPLNQVTTFGWKALYQAGLLWTNEATDLPHLVVLRTKTTMT